MKKNYKEIINEYKEKFKWWKYDFKDDLMHRFPILYRMETYYYNIRNGIRNIIDWLPVVWKDRDYDQNYIYYVLKYKLTKQADHFEKYGITLHNDEIVKQIRLTVVFIDLLIDEERIDEQAEKRSVFFGMRDKTPSENFYEAIEIYGRDDFRNTFNHGKKIPKYVYNIEEKHKRKLRNYYCEMIGRCLKHSNKWWD